MGEVNRRFSKKVHINWVSLLNLSGIPKFKVSDQGKGSLRGDNKD